VEQIIRMAQEVFDTEIEGLTQVRDSLNGGFSKLVEACCRIFDNGGKVVFCGVGKSGHIGQKLAATLASTGSPATFLHPVEAMHGDLGVLREQDILIALSYSGETEELLNILPAAKRFDVTIAAITGYPESKLAKWSDILVTMTVPREACPFNLAPTTSTTALLALGDALAITLLKLRGFTKEDYGRLHPGGAIGRSVTMRVSDAMRSGDRLVRVGRDTTVKDTLFSMTQAKSGSAIVIDADGRLLGIFTDGDFRRHVEHDLSVLNKRVGDVMTANPAAIFADQMAVEAMKLIESRHIDDIVVVERDRTVVGIIDIQDLPGLKLM